MGNSYLNNPLELAEFARFNVTSVGFAALGWREKGNAAGTTAFAPCFKFSSLLKNSATEECDSREREDEGMSRYIRVFTFYGVCGPVYSVPVNGDLKHWINPSGQTDPYKCSLGASN